MLQPLPHLVVTHLPLHSSFNFSLCSGRPSYECRKTMCKLVGSIWRVCVWVSFYFHSGKEIFYVFLTLEWGFYINRFPRYSSTCFEMFPAATWYTMLGMGCIYTLLQTKRISWMETDAHTFINWTTATLPCFVVFSNMWSIEPIRSQEGNTKVNVRRELRGTHSTDLSENSVNVHLSNWISYILFCDPNSNPSSISLSS